MRLQSAIFDMDGTLLDSMFIWNDLGARTLRTLGIEPEANLGEKLKVLTVRQGAAYCKDAYHMTQSVDEIVALIEAQVEDFYTHQVQAKAGVVKFLSLLKMEGVWMYVATATDLPGGRSGKGQPRDLRTVHAPPALQQKGHRDL